MQRPIFSQQFISLFVSVTVGLAIIPSLPVNAETSSPQSTQSTQSTRKVSVAFQPPAGQGMPKRTAGGASRTGKTCSTSATSTHELTALIPALQKPNAISSNLTGLTVESTPTFYFFVPAMDAKEALFSLKDKNDQDLYNISIPLSGKAGIVSVQLPPDVSPLEMDQSYRWSFGVVCPSSSSQQQSEVVFVTGEVRRIEADDTLTRQLQNLTPLEQAAVYAQNGIWFESIKIMANLRQTQPNDLTLVSQWEELLNSIGLEDIAQQPFIN